MITTNIDETNNYLVIQRLRGIVSVSEVEVGTCDALGLIEQIIACHLTAYLLLDLRELHFADLRAHRTWREGFLAHPVVRNNVRSIAIVGPDTFNFRMESELLKTQSCRFFLSSEAAQAWLHS